MGAEDTTLTLPMGGGEESPGDEGSVAGLGREIMLPEKGNPFGRGGRPFGKRAAPDASAAEVALEAKDLTLEEIAALFPSKHEDRQPLPATPAPIPVPAPPLAGPIIRAPQRTLPPRPAARPFARSQPAAPFQPAPAPAVTAATAPPPTATSARLPEAGGLAALIAAAPFKPTSPEADTQLVADVTPPVPPDPRLLKLLVTDDKIAMLMLRIDQAEGRAIQQVGGDKSVARLNLNQIEAARNLLIGGRANYEDAEREIGEVEARLITAEKVKRWSYTFGLGILIYDLVWLGGLFYFGIFATPQVLAQVAVAIQSASAASALWTAVLAGGLGGVTGSLYSLWVHIAREQDFDPQHLMWYLTNPIMGSVLGIFVYLVVVGGTVTIASGGLGDKSNGIIAVLAWLCGFQQNVAYELVERAIAVFRKPKGEGAAPAVTPAAATTPEAKK